MADDHPALPPRPEVIARDVGGWVSGPSATAEKIPARDIHPGDRLLIEGLLAEVTDVRTGFWHFPPPDGHSMGIAIGWRSGERSSGVMFRKAADLLQRITDQP